MKVGQRLLMAVLPAVLGVLAMAGLAYWGQRGRQVPEALLVVGLLLAVVSLGLVWHNARYVARRIDALSRSAGPARDGPRGTDELDAIESRLAEAERRGGTREQAAEALVREYALLLAETAGEVGRRLDEVRLPLHILLSSPFGELNENQEEMLGAAQGAAEAAHEEVRTLTRIVELDAGRVESRPQAVRPRDLLAPVLAAVESRTRSAGASFVTDLPLTLPHVQVDPEHTREALSLILGRLAAGAVAGADLRLVGEPGKAGGVRLRIHDGALTTGECFRLAERLLRLQGASTRTGDGYLEVCLPPFGAKKLG